MFLSLYDEVTNVLCVRPSVTRQISIRQSNSTVSSDTGGLPELLPLHKQRVS